MIHKKIMLDETDANVYLTTYVSDKIQGFTRDAILVIPGGGYNNVCSEREGEPIAQAFMPYGFDAFVLNYSTTSTSDKKFPTQLIEASKAIKHIKDNAEEYGINPDRVFVVGFSAGGHLTASLGTMWNMPEIYEAVDMPYGYNKPAGIMLIYGALFDDDRTYRVLLGIDNPTEEEYDRVRIPKHIDENTSPIYMAHSSNDERVSVINSLEVARVCTEQGITFELHVYPDAPHGVALGNKITECGNPKWNYPQMAKWIENAAQWAETIK